LLLRYVKDENTPGRVASVLGGRCSRGGAETRGGVTYASPLVGRLVG
jgi:hypothetical protein